MDQAIHGGSHGDYASVGRTGQGIHGDPTANRAIRLLEAGALEDKLRRVREWLDTKLDSDDRPLLLAIWRQGIYGWYWVSRELQIGVIDCQARWDRLCGELANWLS